jgi:hypothetical protein
MKRFILIAFSLMLLLTSCKKDKSDQESGLNQDTDPVTNPDPEVFFKIGSNLYYKYNDLELYDSSTHIMYFKTSHPEFEKNSGSTFAVIVKSDTIYRGDFWPAIRSDLPTRPYISTWPFWLQNFALWIDNRENIKPDLRNSLSIIQSLKERKLLHSGLLVVINSLEITSSKATFSFSVTNKDQSPLLVMDPDKMGLNLFHYYTNGLVFRKSNNGSPFYVKVAYQAPSPYNSWRSDWLTQVNPNDSKTFIINYPLDSPIASGEYNVTFDYPGLSQQVSRDQIIQGNVRIWLGKITASVKIAIK